jgi:protein-S-isoprenylcysteine O-methyltransferase Ste14
MHDTKATEIMEHLINGIYGRETEVTLEGYCQHEVCVAAAWKFARNFYYFCSITLYFFHVLILKSTVI